VLELGKRDIMKVVVSGAGGYIGIPLCHAVLERGHSLIALDRYFFGQSLVGDLSRNPNAIILVEDIRNVDALMLRGVDAVIDLAGLSNDASADIDPAFTQSINLEGGSRLAQVAKEAGVRRYVYSSSASVYGHGIKDSLTETDECRPQTLYAQSKLAVEAELARLASSDFEVVIFRNATVFGLAPRMRFDLAINIMTLRAWRDRVIYIMGGGEQWRPFVHVNDVVRALMLGLEEDAERVSGETFNVGGDDMNYRISMLAQFVRDVISGVEVHQIPDDVDRRTYNLSFAKIKQRLGFQPNIRPHEGIVEIKMALERGTIKGDDPTCYTLQWYRSLLDWEKRLKEVTLRGRIF
jgi:nucleoside-diphosphate-sugar epimerase